jgi:tetratricopeptide (TPR) repeat protein
VTEPGDAMLAADRAPGDVAAQIAAADACDRAGSEHDAIRYYDRAWQLVLRLGDSVAFAQDETGIRERRHFVVGYGSTLRNVGRADEAVALLGDAAAADPDYAPFRAFLALALLAAGHPRAAVATLLGVALDVARPDALDGFARALDGYYQELLGPELTARGDR